MPTVPDRSGTVGMSARAVVRMQHYFWQAGTVNKRIDRPNARVYTREFSNLSC